MWIERQADKPARLGNVTTVRETYAGKSGLFHLSVVRLDDIEQ